MQASAPASDAATAEDALMQLMLVVGRRFRTRVDGDLVDASQASLLYVLKCRGAMRLGDLAEAMQLDASTVSRHVQQLGDRGLIKREPDPEDGRARIIALSRTGATSLAKTFDQRRAFITEALEDWSVADRERLRDDLSRLAASFGAA